MKPEDYEDHVADYSGGCVGCGADLFLTVEFGGVTDGLSEAPQVICPCCRTGNHLRRPIETTNGSIQVHNSTIPPHNSSISPDVKGIQGDRPVVITAHEQRLWDLVSAWEAERGELDGVQCADDLRHVLTHRASDLEVQSDAPTPVERDSR